MHIEKNVIESFLETLLGMDGKNKDSLNGCLDYVELNFKPKYHPYLVGSRTKYNLMPNTLKPVEKTLMCEVLSWSELPDRFASNISRCVQLEVKKVVRPKSHDCHIIMQYLLPLAIRKALPREPTIVLLELCSYFLTYVPKLELLNILKSWITKLQ